MRNVLLPQLKELARRHSMSLTVKEQKDSWIKEEYVSFSFRKPEWPLFEITFMFESDMLKDMRCGYRYIEKRNKGLMIKPYEDLAALNGGLQSERWPWYRKCEGYSNWQTDNVIAKIYNGSLIEMIEKDLVELLKAEDLLSMPNKN